MKVNYYCDTLWLVLSLVRILLTAWEHYCCGHPAGNRGAGCWAQRPIPCQGRCNVQTAIAGGLGRHVQYEKG